MGPLFVDWTAYRSSFEQQAGAILGQPVRVAGTADASLIPIPTLAFTDVVIGDDPSNPMMTVGRFDIQVELFPLLQGEVRVTEMRLESPVLRARIGADGGFDWLDGAGGGVDPKRVVLDKVDIVRGRILVLDERRPAPIEITDINAALEARSLIGPYKLDGAAVFEGEPAMVRISTGEADQRGQMIVKASVTPASRPVALTLDGVASVDGRQPEWTGTARLERVVPEGSTDVLPWSVDATLDADPNRLLAKDLEFRYGPPDRPFSIDGAATVDLAGDPSFEAVLSARQIDLDRTLGAAPGEPVAFPAVLSALSDTLASLPRPPMRGRIGFDIPGIVVGGGLIQDVRLDLLPTDDGWTLETLEAGLPGGTDMVATGDVVTRPALAFEGTVAVASAQPSTLVSWWYPDRQRTSLSAFEARGRVDASAAGVAITDLAASLGEAEIAGRVSYAPPRADAKGSIALALAADQLSVEQVAAIADLAGGPEGAGGLSGVDLRVELSADSLIAGETTAAGIDVAASLVDGTLAVERFTVADLAGARLTASGTVTDIATAPDGSIQARLAAERLDGVAALVQALAPQSIAADMLRTAAPVLTPATLEATITAARGGSGTDATVRLAGTAGGSTLDGTLDFDGRVDRWREASLNLALMAEGPNGVRLMRQLGFDVPDVASAGVGRVDVEARGVPAEGIAVTLDGALGATRVRADGTATLPVTGKASAAFDLALASDDVGPILALSGNPMADILASTPVDLTAAATVDGGVLGLAGLEGTVDGEPVRGALSVDVSPAVPSVTGDLAIRSASAEALLELALGPGTLAFPIVESRSPWPEAPFGLAALDGMTTDVALSIDRVPVGDDLVLDDVTTALRSSASGVGFDDISAGLAGGRLGGGLVVKQDLEGQAAVSGTLTLKDARAEELVWERDGRPVVAGDLAVDLEFSANGRTVAGLVSSLSGGGAFRLADGVIRQMNPQAFSAVIRAADAGQEMTDERIRDLFADNIDVGNLRFDRIESTFTIASGVLRAPTIVVSTGEAVTSGSAVLDLPNLGLTSDWQLAVAPTDADAGSPPQVGILFRGDLAEPARSIDVTAFSSYLGIRAFERETERVLAMQADILERELLSRTILRAREDEDRRRRAAEAAAAEAEARRIAEEAEARRAAEEILQSPVEQGPTEQAPIEPAPEQAPQPIPDAADAQAPQTGDFTDRIRQRLETIPAPARELEPLLPGIDISPPPGGLSPG